MVGATREHLPVVGRKTEFNVLETEFRRVLRGEFRCVLIEGEAGIGKSRLAKEFQNGHRRRALPLAARGYLFGASTPFGLWVEALDGHLGGLSNEEVRRLCGGALDDLATLLPAAATAYGRVDGPSSSRIALLKGFARLLESLTRDGPVILHLDDVHLADASSCEALDFIAHNLPRSSVLVLACARTNELFARWASSRAISRLEREGMLGRIELQPLTAQATAELAAASFDRGPPSPKLKDWLFERSRGNPLFATALLDALVEEDADPAEPTLAAIPHPLRRSVLERSKALPAQAQRLLELLVVLGRRVGIGDLVMFTATTLEDLAIDLQAVVESGLVAESETGGAPTYELAHPLVEETLYVSLAAARRLLLHRTIGRKLTAADRWAEAAPHIARSAKGGDQEGIETLLEAARRSWSRSAFHEAFRIVVALADVLPSGDPRWSQVLDVLSLDGEWFFYQRGEVDSSDGIKIMREIEGVLEASNDTATLASLNFHLAGFLGWGMGDLDEAERRSATAVELFRSIGDEHSALMAANDHAWIMGLEGDFARQEEAALGVVAAAEGVGDNGATLMALGCLATPLVVQARFQEAEAVLRRSIDLARVEGNPSRHRYGHSMLAFSLAYEGRLREAAESLGEGMRPQPDRLALEIAIQLRWLSGDLRGAVAEATRTSGSLGSGNVVATASAAMCEAERGEVSHARVLIADAREMARRRRFWLIEELCRWAGAVVAWTEEDLDKAADELRGVVTRFHSMGVKGHEARALLDLGELCALWGRTDEMTEVVENMEVIAASIRNDHYRALAASGAAWADVAAGRNERAATSAREAGTVFASSGHRLLEGRVSEVLGRALMSSDRPEAIAAFEGARAAFDECGAEGRARDVLHALQNLGKPGRRTVASVQGPDSLTSRERDVAALAIEGLTARQIGERLFIGERTVETHLANIYAKVGVNSKVELARRAAEIGFGPN